MLIGGFRVPDRAPDLIVEGYMNRWCVTPRGSESVVYINEFLGPDLPFYHNHPFAFTSIILSGAYVERVAKTPLQGHPVQLPIEFETRRHGAGNIVSNHAGLVHYIEDVIPGTMTLMVTSKQRFPNWGFFMLNKTEDRYTLYERKEAEKKFKETGMYREEKVSAEYLKYYER